MKRLLILVSALVLASPAIATAPSTPIGEVASAQGLPVWLGSYDATGTSKTNAQATVPFGTSGTLLKNKVLLLHNTGSVSIRIYWTTSSTGTVSTTRTDTTFGVEVAAGAKVTFRMGPSTGYLAVITTSSTANVDVWEMI